MIKDDKRLKVYMLDERVMRNMQNRHKRIKHVNSFINARHQIKLRKFLENPLSGPMSRVSGLTIRIPGLGFRNPPMR